SSYFVHGSLSHLALLSFPTRRSSDLGGIELRAHLTDKFVAYRGNPHNGASHTALQSPPIQLGTSGSWRYDLANGYCCGGTLGSLDRKSTRLNSSHRTTSYAVFCLKKK